MLYALSPLTDENKLENRNDGYDSIYRCDYLNSLDAYTASNHPEETMSRQPLFPLPPAGTCRIQPKPNRVDTEEKEHMYAQMLHHFAADGFLLDNTMPVNGYTRVSAESLRKVPLDEEERKFLVS